LRRERKTIVSRNPVISVVDDDASVRVATDNLLSALGYIVHTFAPAEEFLRSAHFHDTSCVIADVLDCAFVPRKRPGDRLLFLRQKHGRWSALGESGCRFYA
jgi:hypothetical protein